MFHFKAKNLFVPSLHVLTQVMGIEAASWLIPMTTILPKPFLRQIIWSLSWFDHIIYADVRLTYDGPLFDYAFDYLSTANHTIDDLLFVGQSLGGSISEIVAAQLYGLQKQDTLLSNTSMRAFAFSSPGLSLSSRKFNVDVEDLRKTATVIISENDLLAEIDEQVGMVQDIDCVFEDIVLGCHRIQNSVCALQDSCDAHISHHPLLVSLYCDYVAEYPSYNMLHVWQQYIRNDSEAGFCHDCDRVDMFDD